MNFNNNSADYGGAVYADESLSIPDQEQLTLFNVNTDPQCFFQSETLRNLAQNYNISNGTINYNKKPFIFSLNRANYLGFTLYKDVFRKCQVDGTSFDEFKLLRILSNIQTSDVGSSWVQACYCENRSPDCSRQISYDNIKTGETLIIDMAIVDRRNHTTNGFIKSEMRGSALIRNDQSTQEVLNGCTALIFNIYSFEASQQLFLTPKLKDDSTHIVTAGFERSIELNFLACIIIAQLVFNKLRTM